MRGRGRPVPDGPAPRPVLAAGGRAGPAAARVRPRRHGQGADPVPPGRRAGPGRGRDDLPERGAAPLAEAGTGRHPGRDCPTPPPTADASRAAWERWQEGLARRSRPCRQQLPPLRVLLVLDNLAGHKTPEFVLWLFAHGVMPLYTPLGGSWLNMAESIQRVLKRRALDGQHPSDAGEIIALVRGGRAALERGPDAVRVGRQAGGPAEAAAGATPPRRAARGPAPAADPEADRVMATREASDPLVGRPVRSCGLRSWRFWYGGTRRSAVKKYRVTLTADEREHLLGLIAAGKAAAKKLAHARILLKADAGRRRPGLDRRADRRGPRGRAPPPSSGSASGSSSEGLDAALHRKKQDRPSRERKLDGGGRGPADRPGLLGAAGRAGARGRCSCWPTSWSSWRWSRPISDETVRRTLQKNELKPWLKEQWCIPPKAERGVRRPRWRTCSRCTTGRYDAARPVVCLDEASKQLIGEVRAAAAGPAGAAGAVRLRVRRNGTANLFMVFEPLAGLAARAR